jgi:hypothetical protein
MREEKQKECKRTKTNSIRHDIEKNRKEQKEKKNSNERNKDIK